MMCLYVDETNLLWVKPSSEMIFLLLLGDLSQAHKHTYISSVVVNYYYFNHKKILFNWKNLQMQINENRVAH